MKRLLFFAFCLSLVLFFGGRTGTARAQTAETLTPDQIAALNQELQDAKVMLLEIQQIYGNPALETLNTSDTASLQGALDTLQELLNEVEWRLYSATSPLADPMAINSNLGDVKTTLTNIHGTIAALAPPAASQNLAQNTPVAQPATQVQNIPQTGSFPENAFTNPVPAASPENNQTAQVSAYEKWRWPVIGMLAVIAAGGIWLWRRGEKSVKTESGIKKATA